MQALFPQAWRDKLVALDRAAGEAAVQLSDACKQAGADPTTVHALSGRLFLSNSGWLLLSVPNALVRGAFDALDAAGAELPLKEDGSLNAHISVIRPEEVEQIGGAHKITERGHSFKYTLGPIKEVEPAGWKEMSKVWFIDIQSPDLKNLRKSYGLTPLPNNNKFEFHITIATRRKSVLRPGDVSKFDTNQGSHSSTELVSKAAEAYSQLRTPGEIFAKLGTPLEELRRAKMESDRKNYRAKHQIMKRLIDADPTAFMRDSTLNKKIVGATHMPTGFRIHVPTTLMNRSGRVTA